MGARERRTTYMALCTTTTVTYTGDSHHMHRNLHRTTCRALLEHRRRGDGEPVASSGRAHAKTPPPPAGSLQSGCGAFPGTTASGDSRELDRPAPATDACPGRVLRYRGRSKGSRRRRDAELQNETGGTSVNRPAPARPTRVREARAAGDAGDSVAPTGNALQSGTGETAADRPAPARPTWAREAGATGD